jgi:predicted  nucleic acid-binding Zn-ribbon protein
MVTETGKQCPTDHEAHKQTKLYALEAILAKLTPKEEQFNLELESYMEEATRIRNNIKALENHLEEIAQAGVKVGKSVQVLRQQIRETEQEIGELQRQEGVEAESSDFDDDSMSGGFEA